MIRTHVFGVDPGTTQSAVVVVDAGTGIITQHLTDENENVLNFLIDQWAISSILAAQPKVLVVEQIEAMGMLVGNEVHETTWWAGRFYQAWHGIGRAHRMTRRTVKLHLCGTMRAKDKNIRQALIDRYGASSAVSIGTKKNPGPLYGIHAHEFAALAVARTFIDTKIFLGEKGSSYATTA